MSSKQQTSVAMEDSKPALAPKLRFPEFGETARWQFLPLNRLAIRAKKKNRDEQIDRVLTNSAEFGVVDQRDFFDKDIATQGKLEGYVVVERDSYVYNPRISSTAPVGPISKNKIGTGVMSPLYTVFKFKDDRNDFYEHFFNTSGWHTYMRQASSTGARHDRMAISNDDFMAMPLPVSSPDEQQKIADCLCSLDELISAQGRKVDALKTHKKGLMQRLFPRAGQTQPHLRLPEFRKAGEWKEDALDDIATFRRGSFPQPYGLPEWYDEKNGMPFIQVFDVGDDFRLKDKTKSRISTLGAKKSVFIPVGTLIVTLQGSIGRVAITHYDAYIDRTLLIFESFQKPIEKVFFSRVIQNLFDIEKEKAPGGIIKTITKESLRDFKVKYPKIEEQQRIASCLSSLDELITAHTQKLEALKTHKKGLMQQLFPTAEVVGA
ncbi:restriction endonuclease subunit S [Pseudomonas syringae]|uniref:restriction endonuclease subunit S n=1 Tax=Pseudomonas syringae TaxID=317 RepID=UPI003F765BAB